MISQEKRLIITFRCTTDAIAMEKSCKATGAPGRLIPVPRSISASCGLSWCAPPTSRTALERLRQELALCMLCATSCGRFRPDEGAVAGDGN